LQGPGLASEQTDPAGRNVHKSVQHFDLEALETPGSQASPASTTPLPQTGRTAPEAKSTDGAAITDEGEASSLGMGVSDPVADAEGATGADEDGIGPDEEGTAPVPEAETAAMEPVPEAVPTAPEPVPEGVPAAPDPVPEGVPATRDPDPD